MGAKEVTRAGALALAAVLAGCTVRPAGDALVRGNFTPLGPAVESRGASARVVRPLPITSGTANDYAASFFPDGREIAYVSDRRGNPDIFLRFLPGSGDAGDFPVTLHTARDVSPAVSPTGLAMVFVSFRSNSRGDLYLYNLGKSEDLPGRIRDRIGRQYGGLLSRPAAKDSLAARLTDYLSKQDSLVRLTDAQTTDADPAWAPSGEKIYFSRTVSDRADIFELDLLRGNAVRSVTTGGGVMPAVSPDGKTLAYVTPAQTVPDGGSIRLLNLQTGDFRRLTGGPLDSNPSWSSDGSRIFFSRYADDTNADGKIDPTDNPSIFSVAAKGSDVDADLARLTDGGRYDLFPRERNDRVLFTSAPSGGAGFSNLFSLPAGGPFGAYESTEELARAAAELSAQEPRLAAQAWGEISRRRPGTAEGAEASYQRGLLCDRLNDGSAAVAAWTTAASDPDPGVSRLAQVELARFELRRALSRPMSGTERQKVIRSAAAKMKSISTSAAVAGNSRAAARAALEEGRTWTLLNEEGNAVRAWDGIVEKFPNEIDFAAQAILEKAELYRKFGDTAQLTRIWTDLLRKYPSAVPWSERAADFILEVQTKSLPTEKNRDARLKEISTEQASVPILPARALNRLGERLYERKRIQPALDAHRAVLAQFPSEKREAARAKLAVARALTDQGEYDEAFRLFAEAGRDIAPNDPWRVLARRRLIGNLLSRGRQEFQGGDFKRAVRTYRDLLGYDYDIPQAHRGLIAAYAALGEVRTAISIYSEECRRYPDHYLPRYALGLAYTYVEPPRAGFDRAEPELSKAVDLNGQAVFPHQTLGFVFEKREELLKEPDQYERALDQYLIARNLSDPEEDLQNYADLTMNIGNGYFLLGDYYKAYDAYAAREGYASAFIDGRQELIFRERFARSAFHAGRLDVATAQAERAVGLLDGLAEADKLTPREVLSHRAEILDVRALSFEQAAKHTEAAQAFAQVAELNSKLGQPQNEAKAFRNVARNLFDAPAETPEVREERLARARETFGRSLALTGEHGARTTAEKKTGSLMNISQEVALGEDGSDAARGFSTKAEKDLVFTFLGRIDRERNDLPAALADSDEKRKLLPQEVSIDETKRPAFFLKRSILSNQRGVLLARLGRFAEARTELRASLGDARKIPHTTGLATNAVSLSRLSRMDPAAVPPAEAATDLTEAFETAGKESTPEARKLRARLALEYSSLLPLLLAGEGARWETARVEIPPALKTSSDLLKKAATGLEDPLLSAELDLAQLRWAAHGADGRPRTETLERVRRAPREDLPVRADIEALLLDEPTSDEIFSSRLGMILARVSALPPSLLLPALPELGRLADFWLRRSVTRGDAEGAFNALEWRSRFLFEATRPPLPTRGKNEQETQFLSALHEALRQREWPMYVEALSALEGANRGLASLFRFGIIEAAELQQLLGPDRGFDLPFDVDSRSLRLTLRADAISLGDATTPAGSVRDLYTTGECPADRLCGEVSSAAHLFFALSNQSIFNRRAYRFGNDAWKGDTRREAVAYSGRSDLEKKLGLADWFLAPSPLAIPSARFRLDIPGLPSFEKDVPLALTAATGSSVLVLQGVPSPGIATAAEYLARAGFSSVLAPRTEKDVAAVLMGIDPVLRLAEAAGQAGFSVWGALGYTPEEKTDLAQTLLDQTVAAGAELYRAEQWNPAVRSFEQALSILDTQDNPVVREQLLDAASTAAYKGDDLPRAIGLAQKLVEIRRSTSSPKRADSLQFLGILYSRADQYEPAVAALTEASGIFERSKTAPRQAAESYSTLGIVMENAKRYTEALSYFDRSLQVLGTQGGVSLGDQWRRIGRIYYLRLNDNRRAQEAFEKAVEIFTRENAAESRDEALLELGLLDERRASFDKARSVYADVFARASARNALSLASKAALYTANTHWFQGDYFQAFQWQSKALSLAREAKDDRMVLLCRSTAGLIYWTLNDTAKSLEQQEEALSMARALHSPLDEASAYNNIGLVHREKGNLPKSIEFFEKALAMDRDLKTVWGTAYDLRNMGISETRLKKYAPAGEHLKESARLSKSIGDKVNEAKALQSLGDLYLQTRDWDRGYANFKDALSLARDSRLAEVEWRSLWGLARVTSARKNDEGALLYLREAIDVLEKMSASIKIEEFRNGFIGNKMAVYEDAILLLLKGGEGRAAEAWQYAERARGRSFIDLLGNKQVPVASEEDRELLGKDRASRRTLNDLENSLAAARSDAERKKFAAALEKERKTRTDLLVDIRARRPELSSFVTVDVVPLAKLQSLLGPDTALVEYFLTDRTALAWVISADRVDLVRKPFPRRQLETKVTAYTKLLQSQGPLVKESKELYDVLWAPVAPYLKGKRFVGVSPNGILHYLSFASLFDGSKYIVDRHALFFTPSASVLPYTLGQEPAQKEGVRVLAVGNPDLGNPALSLPFAEKEVGAIAWNFPRINILTGKKATESWVRDNIGKYTVIHLASHGEFDPINPLFSALRLAPSKDSPGSLAAGEIFGLKLQADLVTLSACQTGLAKIEGGDELIGLNRAFLYAGTHSILSSLWRVNDVSTAVLIKHFYRNYVHESKAESLRNAQLKVKDYYPHPGFWAAFFLTGDYR